jgi:hypothetical protein
VAPSADTCPGTLAEKLSRRQATMAQFLPIQVQVISPDLSLPFPPAAKRSIRVIGVLFFIITVRVEYAKIVTSLLPQPSVLVASNF